MGELKNSGSTMIEAPALDASKILLLARERLVDLSRPAARELINLVVLEMQIEEG